ncbi:MAG: peptidoglycan bridge formation glycyltransferase FemA/FemB family protein [Cyanobacteria bacterium SZAS TMP-1]|nr:peptidoglycan bridge formation glycyltransferase FemA/FemB family protein [Cyanobacteria bacterium SZAS TMP-1]
MSSLMENLSRSLTAEVHVVVQDSLESGTACGAAWDALVQSTEASGFMQTLAWADFKRRQGLSVAHFLVFEGEQLAGGCIGYYSIRATGARLLVSPDGPVMPWLDAERTAIYMRHLDTAVKNYCADKGLSAWRIEPRLTLPLPEVLKNFSPAPIDLLPKETLYLDLSGESESIRAGMHHKARYNIKVAERNGVSIVQDASPEARKELYKILEQASQRDLFFLEPASFFEDLIEELGVEGLATTAHVLLAKHQEQIIGGLLLLICGRRATYLYGGIANEKRNLMAGYLLQWRAMLLARDLGATTYDFYGYIEQADPNHLYCQFSEFKRKFGGTPMRFGGAREQFYMDTLTDAVVRAFKEINLVP